MKLVEKIVQLESTHTKNGYKTIEVQLKLNQVNLVDMKEWHMNTEEMVSRKLIQSIINVKKLCILVNKLD